jgi:TonB-dependent starch-binding outer membrane protein SusC
MRMTSATFNTLQYGYDTRWRKPGDITSTPRPFTSTAETNSVSWETGTRYYFKTDYIRLKQLTLGYDVPATLLKRFSVDGVKFYVQGINLWTYTKWPGYDPEFTGANSGIIPSGKNITVGLQVRF